MGSLVFFSCTCKYPFADELVSFFSRQGVKGPFFPLSPIILRELALCQSVKLLSEFSVFLALLALDPIKKDCVLEFSVKVETGCRGSTAGVEGLVTYRGKLLPIT